MSVPLPAAHVGGPGRAAAVVPAAPTSAAVRARAEATWVARAQDGDTAAYERLVLAYQAELVRLGYRMLSDLGEAQDAVQETLVAVWRKLPTLADPLAFHAWIYQLMTRRCLNLLRTRARRRTALTASGELDIGPHQVVETAPGPASVAQTSALQGGLATALAELPADQRACWLLKEMHELTYPEIAYATGLPVSTVRGRIARARHRLAKGMTAWQ